MRRALGYTLLSVGLLIRWPVQIGLWLYGLYFIIRTFIHGGVIAGLISVPVVGLSLVAINIIIHVVSTPFMALVHSLLAPSLERGQEELWARRRREQEAEMLAAERLRSTAERRRALAKLGRTAVEIEHEIGRDDEGIHRHLVETFRNQNRPEAALEEIDELRALVRHHRDRYYKLNDPEISNAAYDCLSERLRALEEAYPQYAQRDGG